MNRGKFLILWLWLTLQSFGLAEDKATKIVMGFNPSENVEALEMNTKLFGEYYEGKTGFKMEAFVATDYTSLIEAMRSGKIQFAWLPPFSLVKAEELAGAQVLLKSVRKGKSVYYSAIITRSDKPIKKVEDLKGKSIAWVDPSSVSGFIFPKANLISRYHIGDPDKFFGQQAFVGGHDAVVHAVLHGKIDAGATYTNEPDGSGESAWTMLLKTEEERKRIRVIFVSDPITGDTLATTKKFIKEHKDIVDKTVDLLLAMGKQPEGRKILNALYVIDSMAPTTSEEFDSVRAAAKILKIN